jgi:site-specific DNA-methyltransferase (adenine-specific)
LLTKYATKGDKILDTHVGSASSLIACHNLGFDYVGFEIDPDYYNMANDRLERVKSQTTIFDFIGR